MVHECVGGGESHCVDLIDLTLFDSKLKTDCAANYAPATKVVHMLVYILVTNYAEHYLLSIISKGTFLLITKCENYSCSPLCSPNTNTTDVTSGIFTTGSLSLLCLWCTRQSL